MVESIFIELSTVIILAVIISGTLRFLKQPLIINFYIGILIINNIY